MENQIVSVTVQELSAVVNGKNSFSKEMLALYRGEIKMLRAEKKARLGSLDVAGITVIVAELIRQGFTLSDTKEKSGKRIDKVAVEFTRKSQQTELQRIDVELEKMLARRALLTPKPVVKTETAIAA
jgi:hypothetical protein